METQCHTNFKASSKAKLSFYKTILVSHLKFVYIASGLRTARFRVIKSVVLYSWPQIKQCSIDYIN